MVQRGVLQPFRELPILCLVVDGAGMIVSANRKAWSVLTIRGGQLPCPLADLVATASRRHLDRSVRTRRAFSSMEIVLLNASGGRRTVLMSGAPLDDGSFLLLGQPVPTTQAAAPASGEGVGEDGYAGEPPRTRSGARRQAPPVVLDPALSDPLTGLPNRRFLTRWLSGGTRRSTTLALLLLGVENLMEVYSAHGPTAVDRVMQAVADRIRTRIRRTDLLCRYGPNEFAVALPGADHGTAQAAAERIEQAITATPVFIGNTGAVRITMSTGISTLGGAQPAAAPASDNRASVKQLRGG